MVEFTTAAARKRETRPEENTRDVVRLNTNRWHKACKPDLSFQVTMAVSHIYMIRWLSMGFTMSPLYQGIHNESAPQGIHESALQIIHNESALQGIHSESALPGNSQ
ncbi:hypothetical protein ACOMHN_052864 [Nucella lapillus]